MEEIKKTEREIWLEEERKNAWESLREVREDLKKARKTISIYQGIFLWFLGFLVVPIIVAALIRYFVWLIEFFGGTV